jgi:hypothetical protein
LIVERGESKARRAETREGEETERVNKASGRSSDGLDDGHIAPDLLEGRLGAKMGAPAGHRLRDTETDVGGRGLV